MIPDAEVIRQPGQPLVSVAYLTVNVAFHSRELDGKGDEELYQFVKDRLCEVATMKVVRFPIASCPPAA